MDDRDRTRTDEAEGSDDAEERREEREEVRERVVPRRADYEPEGTDRRTGLWPTLKKTALEFNEDHMTDWAAALTYYGLLSLFPALIALVSILGVFGDPEETTQAMTDIVTEIGPESAADTFSGPIESITQNRSAAGIMFFVGLAVALWSASGYVGAFMRASNIIWETPEGRPFLKLRPLQIGVTLLLIVLFALVAISLVLTGPIVEAVGDAIGVGSTALTIWGIAKWPVLLGVLIFMVALIYYTAPNVKVPGFKWITPGSLIAVITWIVASAAFAFYVANFGSYDKTYGSLGAIITLLVWLWISNLALLFGMELNAEWERSSEIDAGVDRADKEIQLEPRAEPGNKRTT
ncbi:MAG TPA: YihY/virulence factor BrkB family protein [Solirubrobacterales bacterium]|nr:YihY/virulence factor BrkB family protein [Solirubrobacterales bacterium]